MAEELNIALEVGTTRVRCIAGTLNDAGNLMLEGIGEHESRGMRKGEMLDLDTVRQCVSGALDRAERNGNVAINSVCLIVSGAGVRSVVNQARMPVLTDRNVLGAEVSEHQMQEARERSRDIPLTAEQMAFQFLDRHYLLDDSRRTDRPESLFAHYLTAETLVLSARRAALENLRRMLEEIGLQQDGEFFSAVCSAEAVLLPEQKKSGVCVIDLGGGTTDFVVYVDGIPCLASSIAVGGDHVTQDIATGLNIPLAEAEKLKCKSAEAAADAGSTAQTIPLPASGAFTGGVVKSAALNMIVYHRLDETFQMIRDQLDESGLLPMLGGGVVLTGGGAALRGVSELARKVFCCPARRGKVRDTVGLPGTADSLQYAAAAGCLRLAAAEVAGRSGFGPLDGLFKIFARKR